MTRRFGTSAHHYYEAALPPWQQLHERRPRGEAPKAVAVLPQEVMLPPHTWAERHDGPRRWTPMPADGHFEPMEQPAALVEDIRGFFRNHH